MGGRAGTMAHTPHRFGGEHTELKVDILKQYLTACMTLMKKKPFFTLWYIDAFAGSGTRIETQPASNDLFGFTPEENRIFEGSAKIALGLDRQFDKYRFIENHKGRRSQLNELIDKYPTLNAECLKGDANFEIQKLLAGNEWIKRSNNRGVIFLDPYGLSVDHTTVQAIARTEKLDVWYLFSLEGLFRQAAHDPSKN
jgi:three-Cys-motif partner protein